MLSLIIRISNIVSRGEFISPLFNKKLDYAIYYIIIISDNVIITRKILHEYVIFYNVFIAYKCFNLLVKHGSMAELVDALDLKSNVHYGRPSSSLGGATS